MTNEFFDEKVWLYDKFSRRQCALCHRREDGHVVVPCKGDRHRSVCLPEAGQPLTVGQREFFKVGLVYEVRYVWLHDKAGNSLADYHDPRGVDIESSLDMAPGYCAVGLYLRKLPEPGTEFRLLDHIQDFRCLADARRMRKKFQEHVVKTK